MVRKFINYSFFLLAFFSIGIVSFYISKVYFLKEPIIINNYFSKKKINLKSFLAKKINVDEDRIQIENAGLEIKNLKNFLSINISNLKVIDEFNKTLFKSNKINIKISLFDLIKGLINNDYLLFKNIFIDRIEFEFENTKSSKFINESSIKFLRKIDHNKSNFFKNLKINQFNFRLKGEDSILNSDILFECKSLNFDISNNKEEFLLKCFEKTTKSGLIIKNINYDKNDIYIDGYVEKFSLNLLNFKNFFKNFKLDGELNSYFKIDFNTLLKINKLDLKIFDNSYIIKIINKKRNQLKLNGFVAIDFFKKELFLKNLLVKNYNFDGSIIYKDTNLLSNLKVSFDNNKFNHVDTYIFRTISEHFFPKNKNFTNLISKSTLNQLKSNTQINVTFDILKQKFQNLSLNSKGYYSSFLNKKKLDALVNISSDLHGFYDFKFKNGKHNLKVIGKLEKVKFKFLKLDEIYNLSEIEYAINFVNNKLIINKLNLIKNKNNVMSLKSVILRKRQKFYLSNLKININAFQARYFSHIYFEKFKKNNKHLVFDSGKIVNSKIYITNENTHDKKIEIVDLNFVNLSLKNNSIKFKNLNLIRKSDKFFIGNSNFFINNIPFNANFEINKNGVFKSFGSISFNNYLKSLIFSKSSFEIDNKNLLKFEAEGDLNEKNFDVNVRSILNNSSFFHKLLNLNANNIKKGFVDLNLIFKNGKLGKINNLLINYDDNEFRSNFNFEKPNVLKISKIYSKNFDAKLILVEKENNRFNIKIDAKLVNISHLTNDLIKNQKIGEVNVKFDIVSNKIVLNEKFSLSGNLNGTFKDSKFNSLAKGKIVLGSNTLLDAGQLKIIVGNGYYFLTGQGSLNSGKTKISIKSSANGLPIVTFDTLEGGKLLSALGFTDKIKSGNVKLKVNFLNKNLSEYEGFINAKKFRVINAPKIVKSLSSLSFSGINSLFIGEGVGFILGDAKFKKIGDELKFQKILLNNQTLSIYLEGNYDLSSDLVSFTGSIAPFSIVSKFISVVPAVGELLTGSNKKGVISGQFKLDGKVTDPKIDINVLSFSPGILRQIFSKNWLKEIKD